MLEDKTESKLFNPRKMNFELKEAIEKAKKHRILISGLGAVVFSIIAMLLVIAEYFLVFYFFQIIAVGLATYLLTYYFTEIKPYIEYTENRVDDITLRKRSAIHPGPIPNEFKKLDEKLEMLDNQLEKTQEIQDLYKVEIDAVYEKIDYEIDRINSLLADYIDLREDLIDFQNVLNDALNQTATEISSFEELVVNTSSKIMEFSSLLNSIAKQNKILSLNAEIEAVKVGQLGSGFQVVSNNVQKLADQTKRLSEELKDLGNLLNTSGKTSTADVVEGIEELTDKFRNVGKTVDSFENLLDSLNRSILRLSQLRQSLSKIDLKS